MKNFDIEKIIDEFCEIFNEGKLQKDDLPNSFVEFEGEIEKADDEAFERFRKTKIYSDIIAL